MKGDDRIIELIVDETGERLDSYIAARAELSRSRVEQLIGEGRVTLNGSVPKKRFRPSPGDVIRVRLPPPEPTWMAAEPIPLEIVYQDEEIAVIDKPAGMVVHPAPGNRSGTLVNALLHQVGDLSGIGGTLRPGIVHRLDRDTSGLLVVAKTDRAHQALARAMKARSIRRRYVAACWGHLQREVLTVDAPIGRLSSDRKRMGVVEGGRRAVTHFRVLERWRAADLIAAELETGRTHQIRVHLMHIGHPVVGDRVYGAGRERGFAGRDGKWAAELARKTLRQFLHAAELSFDHPVTGRPLTFTSPLPDDIRAVAEWARGDPRSA